VIRLQLGDSALVKEPSILEEHAYRDTWGSGYGGFNRCSQRFAFGGIVDARRAPQRVCASRASCVVCR
jgi:hypothetical protein